ncbi:MAG: hypothetical protein IID05_09180, partial [Gemmatimonadetes bacterium]|nr:hypothetical protein [Gemmatimonadota bacterium]
AGGLGPDDVFPFSVVRDLVDDHVLVSEPEIRAAMRFAVVEHGVIAEGGGVVALAAALCGRVPDRGGQGGEHRANREWGQHRPGNAGGRIGRLSGGPPVRIVSGRACQQSGGPQNGTVPAPDLLACDPGRRFTSVIEDFLGRLGSRPSGCTSLHLTTVMRKG